MRLFIAMLATETNTFSPMPTGWRSFIEGGYAKGDASARPDMTVGVMLAEWRRLAESDGMHVVEGTSAGAAPAGRTLRSVYEALRDEILDHLRAAMPVDMVLLNLHGAMAAQGYDDCEGDLLNAVRALVGPRAVIGAELDLHCHATELMFASTDAIICYKEYPHIDEIERGRELYAICRDALAGRVKPVTGVFDCRMISMWRTTEEPMKNFVAAMQAAEGKDGILSISFGHGFPWGDVADVGAKLWVIADGDQALADEAARHWGRRIYALREATRPAALGVGDALDRALEGPGPAVLADIADNAGGGAPSDSTFILAACLERGLTGIAIGCIWDPIAVQTAAEAGQGETLRLRIGGKMGEASGLPVDLDVTVMALADAHTQTGLSNDIVQLGPAAWVHGAGIDLILVSRREQVFAPDAFSNLGLDPFTRRIVVVKSTQHFHAAFAPHAARVIYVAAPGAIVPDFANIAYTKRDLDYWPRLADPLRLNSA